MTRVLILLCVIYVTIEGAPVDPYAADMKQREQMGLECLKRVKIDREVIDRAVRTLDFPDQDQKYKEFLSCSYKKQGFQSEDGKILYDNIKEFLLRYYSNKSLERLDACKGITGESDPDRAFNALKCVMETLKQIEDQKQNENDI